MKPFFITLLTLLLGAQLSAQIPCESGWIDVYPCQNIDFWTFISPENYGGGTTNEVWGWTDPLDGTEYILLGKSNGVGFFRMDDPANPLYLGTLPTHTVNSLWRTLRTYNNYMFVGSEANGHGLQVFDLTKLRNVPNPPMTFSEDAYYAGFGRCHTLVIHEETGMLYACGTNTFSGGLHIVNINDPLNPVIAGGYSLDGYTHEAQVVTYSGPDNDYANDVIVFCYNGNNPANLTIVKTTDPTDATTVSITGYPNSSYCHQGWITPDSRFLLMDDELDEYNAIVPYTRTLIWNIEDLDNPLYLGDHFSESTAIDHNQYILGNLDFQSNYTAGLRVLDISGIEDLSLEEVAYFDHYPSDDSPTFNGTWMHYPYFESGIVPVGDIYQGLFILQPNFLHASTYEIDLPQNQMVSIQLNYAQGWSGPIQNMLSGDLTMLDAVLQNEIISSAPASNYLNLATNENTLIGDYEIKVTGVGGHFEYERTIVVHVIPEVNYCADLNNDGVVGAADLILFNENWDCSGNCLGDINQDGDVSIEDFLILIGQYAESCD